MNWLNIIILGIFGIIAIVGVIVIHISTQRYNEAERSRWQQTETLAKAIADEITQKYAGLPWLVKITAASRDCVELPYDIRFRVLYILRDRGSGELNCGLKLPGE